MRTNDGLFIIQMPGVIVRMLGMGRARKWAIHIMDCVVALEYRGEEYEFNAT